MTGKNANSQAPQELAIVTMVYDDTDYLRIWLNYWRGQLPQEQLYVLVHGGNAELEAMAAGTNVVIVDRPEPYPEMEEDRWKMLSEFVSELLETYRVAVYTDVDELLVVDPRGGMRVAERLSTATAPVSHALGLEVIHRGDLEPGKIDSDKPVLAQRNYYRTTSFHSKPCIATKPVKWGRGGHFHDRPGIRFLPDVFCIHLRFYDEEIFLERSRRRRKTTQAPASLDATPHRQWRTSDDAAQSLISSFRDWPVRPWAGLYHRALKWTMKRRAVRTPNELGLYRYRLYSGEILHKFPESFRGLF